MLDKVTFDHWKKGLNYIKQKKKDLSSESSCSIYRNIFLSDDRWSYIPPCSKTLTTQDRIFYKDSWEKKLFVSLN